MGKKNTAKQNFQVNIPILSGSYIDLTKFDFSLKDISVLNIQSKKFESYIRKLRPEPKGRSIGFIKHLSEKIYSKTDRKYAIVPNNPMVKYNEQDLWNVWHLLLIVYPSDLQVEHIIHYYNQNGFFDNPSFSTYPKRISGDYPGNLLYAEGTEILEVNEFAKLYFDRLSLDNYIGFAIENYITSFSASHYHYQYLALCIALESIISGSNELTYRLSRTIAVLCGKDVAGGNNIFNALKKIYALRSDIVHGEKYTHKQIMEYLEYLQALVSRVIIELMIHNISATKELGEIITPLGFGERQKISTGWKYCKLNHSTLRESKRRLVKK